MLSWGGTHPRWGPLPSWGVPTPDVGPPTLARVPTPGGAPCPSQEYPPQVGSPTSEGGPHPRLGPPYLSQGGVPTPGGGPPGWGRYPLPPQVWTDKQSETITSRLVLRTRSVTMCFIFPPDPKTVNHLCQHFGFHTNLPKWANLTGSLKGPWGEVIFSGSLESP